MSSQVKGSNKSKNDGSGRARARNSGKGKDNMPKGSAGRKIPAINKEKDSANKASLQNLQTSQNKAESAAKDCGSATGNQNTVKLLSSNAPSKISGTNRSNSISRRSGASGSSMAVNQNLGTDSAGHHKKSKTVKPANRRKVETQSEANKKEKQLYAQ